MTAPTVTDQEILDLYRSGTPWRRIPASNGRISRVLRDYGVANTRMAGPPRTVPITPAPLREREERNRRLQRDLPTIIAEYEAGSSYPELEQKWGYTRSVLYPAIKRSGIPVMTAAERKRQAERKRWKEIMDAPEIRVAPEGSSRWRQKLNQRRIQEALANV